MIDTLDRRFNINIGGGSNMYFVVNNGTVILNSNSVDSIEIVKSKNSNFDVVMKCFDETYIVRSDLTMDEAKKCINYIASRIEQDSTLIDFCDSNLDSAISKLTALERAVLGIATGKHVKHNEYLK